MKQILLALALSSLWSCLGPTESTDAGPSTDAGQQCSADGTTCWAPQTFCESAPCTYQFPDTGGRCGDQPIRPSCACARNAAGSFHPQCTGGCVPQADGGSELLCLTPNCGSVNCGTGTTCLGFGRCE